MTYVFYGLRWKTDPVSVEIWYHDPHTTEIIRKTLEIGTDFNIEIRDGTFCTGSETGTGVWISCKQRRLNDGEEEVQSSYQMIRAGEEPDPREDIDFMILPDSKSYKQCYRCSMKDYFSCRMTCIGDICTPTSDRAQQLCNPPNTSVYLTYVGNEYKIGVSLGIPRRWIEQGSDLATVVATAPGLEARRLEQYAARELDLKLQVRSSTKMRNLNAIDIQEGKKMLQEKIQAIQPLVGMILEKTEGVTHRQPRIHNLSHVYGSYDTSVPIQEIEVSPGTQIGGEIIAVKGGILILKQGRFQFAVNLKQLIGQEFTFLDIRPQIETQSHLDQWF